ncbi:MAG: protein phosphatase 2C domain-containing protein, partial [Rhodocyclales bacterium CG_4_9_14_3_um_filter_68_10]
TCALGATRQLGAWHIEVLPPADRTVILCTDGVADDLLEDRYFEFARWVDGELAPLPPGVRWRRVARELRAWPTPNHIDDKTLAVITRQA